MLLPNWGFSTKDLAADLMEEDEYVSQMEGEVELLLAVVPALCRNTPYGGAMVMHNCIIPASIVIAPQQIPAMMLEAVHGNWRVNVASLLIGK